jgi:hypothetical protein
MKKKQNKSNLKIIFLYKNNLQKAHLFIKENIIIK